MAGCYNATLLDASPEDVTPVGAIPGTEVGDNTALLTDMKNHFG